MQAFVAKHEETATNLRHQMAQLQEKHSEKVADHKKIQEKATTFENKYRKAKDELKLLREENARLRKLVERKGKLVIKILSFSFVIKILF